ncbi:DUF1285 domain-containing protein [Mangrovitalea sediminis]|uniref:DUF1285 domain-containing protein n=1 Tax=Mangrovitalea sediminis TaxID=1982043 RepID=UPI000BE5EC86|nr:DUF1285 domain-containing protein [Mangrovitalea sediminis]
MQGRQRDPESLAQQVEPLHRKSASPPPVESWHPEFSGDIDIRIARDGQWYFKGAPIERQSFVALFSTILRKDDDGDYYLVTPVEKWRIRVDDAPFVAHSLSAEGQGEGQKLSFVTNAGDTIVLGADHPLEVHTHVETGEPSPYIRVRRNLYALIERSTFYHLVELAVSREGSNGTELGVWSDGNFYPIGTL